LISSLEFDAHMGRYLIGKITQGTIKTNDAVAVSDPEGEKTRGRVKKIMVREGLGFVEVSKADAGEIVAIVGIESTAIGATLCDVNKQEPLPVIKISPPSVRIKFEANSSPLVGKDGKYVTAKILQQRLDRERETNISLQITKGEDGSYYVAGRGELQLSILIETLRREGYEFQIRKPEVVIIEEDGVKMEPVEELIIDTNEEFSASVASVLSTRRAEMVSMEVDSGQVQYTYKILTRNLLGLRNVLLTNTKGNVILNNYLSGYLPVSKQPDLFRKGALVATDPGFAMAYTLNMVQWRGELFIESGEEVYEGMIVGINKYEQDLEVNVTKEKHQSGVRVNSHQKTHIILNAITPVTLDFALLFIGKDEILEVTPNHLRLRKQFLTKNERNAAMREIKYAQENKNK
jgi:GTP-binding protein